MAQEPKVKVSFSIPQRLIDALTLAAGPHRSRSSVLGELLDKAISEGWIKATKKGKV